MPICGDLLLLQFVVGMRAEQLLSGRLHNTSALRQRVTLYAWYQSGFDYCSQSTVLKRVIVIAVSVAFATSSVICSEKLVTSYLSDKRYSLS